MSQINPDILRFSTRYRVHRCRSCRIQELCICELRYNKNTPKMDKDCHYFICKKKDNNKKAIDCAHVRIYEVEARDYEPSNATNRYAKETSDCGQNISHKYTRQLRIQSLRQHILAFRLLAASLVKTGLFCKY